MIDALNTLLQAIGHNPPIWVLQGIIAVVWGYLVWVMIQHRNGITYTAISSACILVFLTLGMSVLRASGIVPFNRPKMIYLIAFAVIATGFAISHLIVHKSVFEKRDYFD